MVHIYGPYLRDMRGVFNRFNDDKWWKMVIEWNMNEDISGCTTHQLQFIPSTVHILNTPPNQHSGCMRWNHMFGTCLIHLRSLSMLYPGYIQNIPSSMKSSHSGLRSSLVLFCGDVLEAVSIAIQSYWVLWTSKTGWWFQPLWKIWTSVGMIIPNIWKNKTCSKPPAR